MVRRLQDNWPECQITWVIGRLEHSLLEGIDGVEFIVFNKRDMRTSLRSLTEQMDGRHYDVLLHMQAALRASRLARRIPADIRLGYDRARARDFQWLFSDTQIDAIPRQHVMQALMGFADRLGAAATPLRWDIPVPQAARDAVTTQLNTDAPYLVIVPCSSQRARNFRNWPAESCAAAAEHAAERHGLQVVLAGGNSALEREYADRITRLSRIPVVDLVGKTSLKEMLALLAGAQALISPDTGPVHMAGTVGTPVVGLYASSNPERTGPIDPRFTVNHYPQALLEDSGKTVAQARWGQRVRDPQVMLRIPVEDVCAKIDQVMAEARQL